MIIHATTWSNLRPPTEDERVDGFRDAFKHHVSRQRRDALIAGGVRWQDAFRRRPIPKHRALTLKR